MRNFYMRNLPPLLNFLKRGFYGEGTIIVNPGNGLPADGLGDNDSAVLTLYPAITTPPHIASVSKPDSICAKSAAPHIVIHIFIFPPNME